MRNVALTTLLLITNATAFGQDYATAFAKLDAVFIGESFTPAASTAVDDEVGSNDAPLQGTGNTGDIDEAGPISGIPYSLHFNGSDHYLDLTTQINYAGAFTVVWWSKRDATGSDHTIVGKNGDAFDFIRFADNTTDIDTAVIGSIDIATHGVDTTAWHHYAVTRDGSNNMDLYVDGSLVDDNYVNRSAQLDIDWIGAKGPTVTQFFDGNLAQVGFANEALTATDIAQLYAGPPSGSVIPLIHYYRQQMGR